MAGADLPGPVLIFDDDYYYMANVLADLLASQGKAVIYVTPSDSVAPFTAYTMEQGRITKRLLEQGARILNGQELEDFKAGQAQLSCVYTEREIRVEAASLLLVTSRAPNDGLLLEAKAASERLTEAGIKSVTGLGDCLAPSTVAAAVYDGHRYARSLGETLDPDATPFRRERTALS